MKLTIHIIGTENSVRGKRAGFVLQFFVHKAIGIGSGTLAQYISALHEGCIATLLNVTSALVCASGLNGWCMNLGVVVTLRVC